MPRGGPSQLMLTPGQAGDAPVAAALLEDLAAGATLIADRAYDTNAIRAPPPAAPGPTSRRARSASGASPSPAGSIASETRGIATRYDKCPENYLAAVKLICARIWCASYGGDLGRSGA